MKDMRINTAIARVMAWSGVVPGGRTRAAALELHERCQAPSRDLDTRTALMSVRYPQPSRRRVRYGNDTGETK